MISVRFYLVVLVALQFICLGLNARAQQTRLQSLEDSLYKVNSAPQFIDLLNELGKEYIFVNPTKAYSYSDSARVLSEKIKVFSIVDHDFKSPINTLKGFSELLANNFEMFSKEHVKSTTRDIKNYWAIP
ncbi:MAG TPA: hypothetical protein DDY13_17775 [Cytophagales bacterium]|jgi:signal transduction histidine kinase|nr:hypothetical protein [Cytophagales bacterium]